MNPSGAKSPTVLAALFDLELCVPGLHDLAAHFSVNGLTGISALTTYV